MRMCWTKIMIYMLIHRCSCFAILKTESSKQIIWSISMCRLIEWLLRTALKILPVWKGTYHGLILFWNKKNSFGYFLEAFLGKTVFWMLYTLKILWYSVRTIKVWDIDGTVLLFNMSIPFLSLTNCFLWSCSASRNAIKVFPREY